MEVPLYTPSPPSTEYRLPKHSFMNLGSHLGYKGSRLSKRGDCRRNEHQRLASLKGLWAAETSLYDQVPDMELLLIKHGG
jgi:hypothetical protein